MLDWLHNLVIMYQKLVPNLWIELYFYVSSGSKLYSELSSPVIWAAWAETHMFSLKSIYFFNSCKTILLWHIDCTVSINILLISLKINKSFVHFFCSLEIQFLLKSHSTKIIVSVYVCVYKYMQRHIHIDRDIFLVLQMSH